MNNETVMKMFFETQLKKSSVKVLNALEKLQPINLTLDNIVHLYQWIEENYRTEDYAYKHVNIFGTGGDKTVNISTITSIIASKYVNVIKVGTRAVTSNWGSLDFITGLKEKKGTDKIYYSSKSKYIGLPELGYHYSSDLVTARRKLHSNKILDIYKLIFPLVNFTNAFAQINGVHRIEYLNYYLHVYKKLKKTGVVIYNDNDIDEIYFGRNYIYCIQHGLILEKIVLDIEPGNEESLNYFKESKKIEGHLAKLDEIINKKVDESIRKVILMNVAIVVMAYNDFEHDLQTYFQKINKAF